MLVEDFSIETIEVGGYPSKPLKNVSGIFGKCF